MDVACVCPACPSHMSVFAHVAEAALVVGLGTGLEVTVRASVERLAEDVDEAKVAGDDVLQPLQPDPFALLLVREHARGRRLINRRGWLQLARPQLRKRLAEVEGKSLDVLGGLPLLA